MLTLLTNEFKTQLLKTLKASSNAALALGHTDYETFINNMNLFHYISLDQNNMIMGYYSYEVLPTDINSQEMGACNIRVINLSDSPHMFA
jgi:hypothetical protein